MVHLVQTVLLSCLRINSISKRTNTSFHLTNVTKKYHCVCLKRFPCPWYIRRKLCTYPTSRLIQSPNSLKQASTWPTSTRSTIGCAWKVFHARGTFSAKPYAYIAPRLILSPIGPKWASTWPMSPRSTIRCAWKDFHAHGTFGTNCTHILRLDWYYLQTDQNELPLDPRHLGLPSGASKIISKPMVPSAPTVHLSCTETNTIS
jgi:hypothetical protein